MAKVAFVIVGETRTWNQDLLEKWQQVFNKIQGDVSVHGYTWNYCNKPIGFNNPNRLTVLDFNGNWVFDFEKYAEATTAKFGVAGDPTFFPHYMAQHYMWAYAIDDAYTKYNPDIIFKIRWDSDPEDIAWRGFERAITENNRELLPSLFTHSIKISDGEVSFDDHVFGVDKKWVEVTYGRKTPSELLISKFKKGFFNAESPVLRTDYLKFLYPDTEIYHSGCLCKDDINLLRDNSDPAYQAGYLLKDTDDVKCNNATLRPRT